MADSLQSMIANRMQGETRARLQRFYIEQGYSPEVAAAKAAVEMANRDREARINGPEAGFTGRQGDIVERASRLSAQEPGYYGEQGQGLQQSIYRADPRRLGMDQPATPSDLRVERTLREEYNNPSRSEVARSMPQFSSAPPVRREMVDVPNQLPLTPGQIAQYVLGQAPSTRMEQTVPNAEAEAERKANRVPVPWYRNFMGTGVQLVPSAMPPRESTRFDEEARANSERISRELGQQPGYVAPRESTSAPANRLIDSAMSVVTGQPIAQTQPSPQTLTGQAASSAPAGQIRNTFVDDGVSEFQDLYRNLAQSQSANFGDENAIPNPNRTLVPAERTALAAPARRAAPAPQQTQQTAQASQPWYSRLLSGPAVQSNSQALTRFEPKESSGMGPGRGTVHVNWGDRDNAADFFRADKAMREAQEAGQEVTGMKRGGAAGGGHHKDAVVMKALEIIHHMLRTR
jgi:hypothetical protein